MASQVQQPAEMGNPLPAERARGAGWANLAGMSAALGRPTAERPYDAAPPDQRVERVADRVNDLVVDRVRFW